MFGYQPISKLASWLSGTVLILLLCTRADAEPYVEHLMSLRADLDQPGDIAVSDSGSAYLLDGSHGRVVVFTPSGKRKFAFGSDGSGAGELKLPMGITIEGEQVYIADTGNHRIAIFDLHGKFVRNIPLVQEADSDGFPEPVALIVRDGVATWSDRRNHRVCRTELINSKPDTCWGKRGEGEGQFQFPFQIAVDRSDYLHVVDVLNGRIQIFNHKGRYFSQISRFGIAAAELYRPNGVAFDDDGRLFVSDSYRGTVSIFVNGRFTELLTEDGLSPRHFHTPVGIAWRRGQLYVVDAANSSVEVFRISSGDVGVLPVDDSSSHQESTSRKNCVTCHLSWAEEYRPGEYEQDGVLPVATPRMCYSCHHGAVIDSRRAIGRGEQHPDIHHQRKKPAEHKQERQDEIPAAFPLTTDKQLSCGSCHTPHSTEIENTDTLYEAHANPWLRVFNNDGDLCQRCHESKSEGIPEKQHALKGVNHPVGIFLKKPPQANAEGYATNERLHNGLPETLLKAGANLGGEQQMICQSCHQIHGAKDEKLLLFDNDKGELCGTCHERHHAENKEEARDKGVHPVNMELEEPVEMGEEEVKKVNCLSCHSMHGGKSGTPLLRFDHRNGKLCSYCHEGKEDVVNSDHDLRITAQDSRNLLKESPKEAGACGSCHTMHRGQGEAGFLYAGEYIAYEGAEMVQERDLLCLDCHRDKGIAKKAVAKHLDHPSRDLVLRSDSNVMPLLDKHGEVREFGAIACITCHEPHHWTPGTAESASVTQKERGENQAGNVLNSFLRRKGVDNTFCVDCHGLETRLKYKYYHDKFSRDVGVDYIK